VFPADQVSSTQNGGAAHVDYIKNLSYKIPVPANARYVSGSLSGGFNYGTGTPTVTLQGTPTTGNIIYAIPGPIQTDQQFQIPALTLTLLATGPQQSSVSLQLGGTSVTDPGFTTTAHVTSPFNGDAATSC
jgi:dehydratase